MSFSFVGRTHDSLYLYISSFAQIIRNSTLHSSWWVAGDAAYTFSDGLITPWTLSALLDPEECIYRDYFNYYHSSACMAVKQAFGILVSRLEILWLPMRYELVDYLPIISVLMRLYNFAIDHGDNIATLHIRTPIYNQQASQAFATWWFGAQQLAKDISERRAARRRDLEKQ